jgi:hypothetical protein
MTSLIFPAKNYRAIQESEKWNGSAICVYDESDERRRSMNPQKRLEEFPEWLYAGTEHHELRYVRTSEYYALRPWQPDSQKQPPVTVFADESLAVFKGAAGQSDDSSKPASLIAVYAPEPGGGLAVPTGRVFVRFAEQVAASSQKIAIERAGYVILETMDYAPNAAWVGAASGDVAESLKELPALEKLPLVENVEPQMLRERAKRQ